MIKKGVFHICGNFYFKNQILIYDLLPDYIIKKDNYIQMTNKNNILDFIKDKLDKFIFLIFNDKTIIEFISQNINTTNIFIFNNLCECNIKLCHYHICNKINYILTNDFDKKIPGGFIINNKPDKDYILKQLNDSNYIVFITYNFNVTPYLQLYTNIIFSRLALNCSCKISHIFDFDFLKLKKKLNNNIKFKPIKPKKELLLFKKNLTNKIRNQNDLDKNLIYNNNSFLLLMEYKPKRFIY